MKFKKAYKEMNDDIHGDRALLNSILNGETPKKQNFLIKISHGHTWAALAACLVLISAVFVSYSHFTHTSQSGQNPSEASISDFPAPPMGRSVGAPDPDSVVTNSEYYGEILSRILSLATDSSCADVADESQIDPLDILIDYPSEDNPSVVTVSKSVDLSALIPDATCSEFEGIHIAVSSSDDETEKIISDKILK